MPKRLKMYPELYGTTLDIKDKKALSINDVVIDVDKIFDMLINDELESSTTWEGVISSKDGSENIDASTISKFIYHDRVIIVNERYYYEFVLDIESNKDLFKPKFLEKMNIK